MNFTITRSRCPGCGIECDSVKIGMAVRFFCEPCEIVESDRKKKEARISSCMDSLRKCTPAEFWSIFEPARVCADYLPALDLDPSQSFGLVGRSFTGKTRLAYQALRKAAQIGLKPLAMTASHYRASATVKREEGGKERVREAFNSQVLLLDDVGKGAVTESGDEALFELLTYRRDNKKTTYWTSNGDGTWIASRYGESRGKAIAVRLASMCGHGSGEPLRIFKEKTGK